MYVYGKDFIRGASLEYCGVEFFGEINIFVGDMDEINKWITVWWKYILS